MSLPSFFDIINNVEEPKFLKQKKPDIQSMDYNNKKKKDEPQVKEKEQQEKDYKKLGSSNPIIESKPFIKSDLFIQEEQRYEDIKALQELKKFTEEVTQEELAKEDEKLLAQISRKKKDNMYKQRQLRKRIAKKSGAAEERKNFYRAKTID